MPSNSDKLLLTNARLVLPDRVAEPAALLIEDDLITQIEEHAISPDQAVSRIDAANLTLYPGFIDVHIHGAIGVDTMAADTAGLRRIGEFLTQRGVTGWLPTLVPAKPEQYEQAVRAITDLVARTSAGEALADNQKSAPSARILGVHYEGPFVNDQQCGALHREHFRTFRTTEDLDDLPVIDHRDAVHMMTLAPEITGGVELIKELTKRRWVSSIGHTRASAEILDQAMAAGARHMTHFMNAMTPLHHRNFGAVGWGLIHNEVSCDLIADGIHIDREILRQMVRTKTTERVALISDAIAAAGLGDGDYQIWGETISVKNGRTANSSGSIAGSVITMLDAVRLMLSLGFSENEVAQMSSTNPAKLLRIDNDCGSIEPGKRADLVGLDKDKNVRLTIVGGQVAFQDLS